jgi:fibronectin type III domain protein
MTRPLRILPVALIVAVALTFMVPPSQPWAKPPSPPTPFAATQIRFEKNASGNDLGIQVFLDGEPWRRVEIFGPDGRRIFEVEGRGSLRGLGLTELFFESNEPSLDEVPLEDLLALFPAGTYTFVGKTVDGARLTGTARLTHDIPDGPVIVAPTAGAVVDRNNAVISWRAVTTPAGIEIAGYQVIVLGGEPSREFNVRVLATTTSVTVSREFLEPGTAYTFEVLAIEASGNQTITEGSFRTP